MGYITISSENLQGEKENPLPGGRLCAIRVSQSPLSSLQTDHVGQLLAIIRTVLFKPKNEGNLTSSSEYIGGD